MIYVFIADIMFNRQSGFGGIRFLTVPKRFDLYVFSHTIHIRNYYLPTY